MLLDARADPRTLFAAGLPERAARRVAPLAALLGIGSAVDWNATHGSFSSFWQQVAGGPAGGLAGGRADRWTGVGQALTRLCPVARLAGFCVF